MALTSLVLKDGTVLELAALEREDEGSIRLTLGDGSERELDPEELDVEATLLANAPGTEPARAPGGGLELKALSHDVSGEYLTVEGLVANGSAEELRDLAVKVMGYDDAGDFITSGEALLDFNPLAVGAESPFKAILKSAGRIKKATVQFYHLMGEVLPHHGVDSSVKL